MPSYRPFILGALTLCALSISHPMAAQSAAVPDSITLNRNGDLFRPFTFDHAEHIRLIKECADCHHHTTGTLVTDPNCGRCHSNSSPTAVVSCKGCHSSQGFSAEAMAARDRQRYHQDKLGLKGAMHRGCIGCHEKQAAGPTGCQECHLRTARGGAFYSTSRKGAAAAKAKGH